MAVEGGKRQPRGRIRGSFPAAVPRNLWWTQAHHRPLLRASSPKLRMWGCPSSPQGPGWEAAGGAHPFSTCCSMASASSVPSSRWDAKLWSRAPIWALAWARKVSRKRSPCRGKEAAPGTVSHEGQFPEAIPAYCCSPGLLFPAGHSPSQKPIQRAPATPGSPKHFWPSRATLGFPLGCQEDLHPPRDGQRCRTTHQRHGDSRPCPDHPTGCPSLPPPWLGGLHPLAASWHPAPPGSSAACWARSPARPDTGTPGPSPAPAVRGDGTRRHQV